MSTRIIMSLAGWLLSGGVLATAWARIGTAHRRSVSDTGAVRRPDDDPRRPHLSLVAA